MNQWILLFQHPTSIALVDDDTTYLSKFPLSISSLGPVKTFASPWDASEYIRKQFLGALPTSLDDIIGQIGNAERFQRCAIVLSDYEMGSMNGIELCRRLGDTPARRILLTGKLDEREAVAAFNNGVIDRYVRKDDPRQLDLIKQYIVELKQEFFSRIAGQLDEALILEDVRYLFDPALRVYFEDNCRANGIVEHFLSADLPGFLLLDADGDVLAFKVLTDRQMAEQLEIAEYRGAPGELLALLRNRLALPHFPSPDGFYQAEFVETWKQWLFTARPVSGKRSYYTAVFSGSPARALLPAADIYSYNQYLES